MPDYDDLVMQRDFLMLPESVSVSFEDQNAPINIVQTVWYNKERDRRVELKIILRIDA